MTFTLFGRWQIRIGLLLSIGVILSTAIMLKSGQVIGLQTFLTLIYLGVFGLIWDCSYHQLQRFRWDGDWNGLLQLISAVWEGLFMLILIKYVGLPGIDRANFNIPGFIGFYTLLSSIGFIVSHSVFRILAPYSRFNGGRLFY